MDRFVDFVGRHQAELAILLAVLGMIRFVVAKVASGAWGRRQDLKRRRKARAAEAHTNWRNWLINEALDRIEGSSDEARRREAKHVVRAVFVHALKNLPVNVTDEELRVWFHTEVAIRCLEGDGIRTTFRHLNRLSEKDTTRQSIAAKVFARWFGGK